MQLTIGTSRSDLESYKASFEVGANSGGASAASTEKLFRNGPCASYKNLVLVQELPGFADELLTASSLTDLKAKKEAFDEILAPLKELKAAAATGVKDLYGVRVAKARKLFRKQNEIQKGKGKGANPKTQPVAKLKCSPKKGGPGNNLFDHHYGDQNSIARFDYSSSNYAPPADFNVPHIISNVDFAKKLLDENLNFQEEHGNFHKKYDGSDMQEKLGRGQIKLASNDLKIKTLEGFRSLYMTKDNEMVSRSLCFNLDQLPKKNEYMNLAQVMAPAFFGISYLETLPIHTGFDSSNVGCVRLCTAGIRKVMVCSFKVAGGYLRESLAESDVNELKKPISKVLVSNFFKNCSKEEFAKFVVATGAAAKFAVVGPKDALYLPTGCFITECVQGGGGHKLQSASVAPAEGGVPTSYGIRIGLLDAQATVTGRRRYSHFQFL